eukprot:1960656-Alexandrium_andersonii.AAC.1
MFGSSSSERVWFGVNACRYFETSPRFHQFSPHAHGQQGLVKGRPGGIRHGETGGWQLDAGCPGNPLAAFSGRTTP